MRVPDWTNVYSMEPSGPVMRTSRPVSSATSRRAVASRRLVAGPGVPFGSVHVLLSSRSRRRLPTTSWARPSAYRTTMPPAEVAVAFLRRATAPRRRWDVGAVRNARSEPSASSPAAGLGDRADATEWVGDRASPSGVARRGRHQGLAAGLGAAHRVERCARSETESPLPEAARRTHESRRRARRVLGGDAVSHGRQWY